MQIESIVLYHRDGERRRVLKFEPGRLNVVTGWRATGKSSLIDIVDYCFGRTGLGVTRGKIRRTVGWYGLVLRHQEQYVFAGRPSPPGNAASTKEAMFSVLAGPEPPASGELAANASVDSLREELSRVAGFADVEFVPPTEAARPPLRLHIAHALPLTIQTEDDIDSRSLLFHRGHEQHVLQALRDALPYIVGAAEREAPALRARLQQLRREEAQLQRQLDRLLTASRDADQRGLALLEQAAATGLVGGERAAHDGPPTGDEVMAALRAAVDMDPASEPSEQPTGELEALLYRRRKLHEGLAGAERDEALLRDFGRDQNDFAVETGEQRARLRAIGLLPDVDVAATTCPVCAQALEQPDPLSAELDQHLRHLDAELASVEQLEPRTRQALEAASERTRELRDELRGVNAALRELAARDRAAAAARGLAERRAFVQGVIDEYLRTAPASTQAQKQELQSAIKATAAEQIALASRLDSQAERDRLDGAMNLVGADMTAMARRLSLEHSAGQVRLDVRRMTVLVDTTQEGTFALDQIGSAGNRVGYHLATHLALHRLLRQRDRPVPAFLLLDQPTGPFYPEDVREGEEPELRSESDREVVAAIFRLIHDVVSDLDGELQVIVCDHARLDGEEWFAEAVVEDWRDGRGLIPDGWDDPRTS